MTGTGTTPTWSSSSTLYRVSCNLTFNAPAGAITVSGDVAFVTSTLTYTDVDTFTLTGSLLHINNACTLNTSGMTWNDVNFVGNSTATITLTSNFNIAGNLRIYPVIAASPGATFAGAFNISCANLWVYNLSSGGTTIAWSDSYITFVNGQTLTVSNSIFIAGMGIWKTIIQSASAAATYLNYGGTAANCKIFNADFTWIDASGSAQVLDNWYGGTLTSCTNINNMTSANLARATDAAKILTGQTVGSVAGSGGSSNVFGII
jgi:hypothetical protein